MNEKKATIEITVLLEASTDIMGLAERLFDFLAEDPDDLFPEIAEVEGFDARW